MKVTSQLIAGFLLILSGTTTTVSAAETPTRMGLPGLSVENPADAVEMGFRNLPVENAEFVLNAVTGNLEIYGTVTIGACSQVAVSDNWLKSYPPIVKLTTIEIYNKNEICIEISEQKHMLIYSVQSNMVGSLYLNGKLIWGTATFQDL